MASIGQTYITVKADETTPLLMSAQGSGSETEMTYNITWDYNGGITGLGWETPGNSYLIVIPHDSDAMNEQIRREFSNYNLQDIMKWIVAGCAS